ncbi:MAG: TolC family protein, partial [Gemmatimonadota bacterium]
VEATYPPLLAALIERDVREGQLQSASSIFDLDLFAKAKGTPEGYYEYTTMEAGAEQFLGVWGSTLYGGYRLTRGETLPDYYRERTQEDGEATVGLQIPILRGGATDKGRTALAQAEVGARMVDPYIARQRLDFLRAASVSYYKWLATGLKLRLARELLQVANERTAGLEQLVEDGLRAPIVLVDNQQLVVSRRLEVIAAERDFQGAGVALSLFLRTPDGDPVVPGEERLPDVFPQPDLTGEPGIEEGLSRAVELRPELVQLELELEMVELERRLARNTLLPYLDARIEAAGNFGDELYSDRSETEVRGELSFKMPLQRREARGKVEQVEAKSGQARQKLAFATDKVSAEVQKAWVALQAALDQTDLAALNVQLAQQMREVEAEQFRVGASDLLALQLREASAFDAEKKAVDAYLDFYTALADYRAAVAEGVILPPPPES